MKKKNTTNESKHIGLKTPQIFSGISPEHGKYCFLYSDPMVTGQTWRNDVEAGAIQFSGCNTAERQDDNTFSIFEADNKEEGFAAILYYNALKKEKRWANLYGHAKHSYTGNDTVEAVTEDEYENDEYDEGSELDFFMANPAYIPIIPIDDIIYRYSGPLQPIIPFFNQTGVNPSNEAKTPYWMLIDNKPICILIEEGHGIYNMSNEHLRILRNFEHLPNVHILYVHSSVSPLYLDDGEISFDFDKIGFDTSENEDAQRDPSITRMLLALTADYIRVSSNPEQHKAYLCRLFESWLKEYSFDPVNQTDLIQITEQITRIDPEHPSEYMEKTLKLLRHNDKDVRCISIEALRQMGLLDINKTSIDDIKLENLVGLNEVKKNLKSIVNLLKFNRLRAENSQHSLDYHNVLLFLGAPGTAKTTTAKALGQMLRKENLLKRDRFISLTGTQLKAEYVGQTAPKVHALFQEYDILLIDEAYSLAANDSGHMDIFAQEALAQLAVELEEHATDKVVIFAGYGGDYVTEQDNRMDDFLNSNPGIRSRINFVVSFPSYGASEMLSIIRHIARERGLRMTHSADKEILAYYELRANDRTFGNGREARVFVENAERLLADRFANVSSLPKNGLTITRREILDTLNYLRKKDQTNCPYRQYGII